MPNEWTLSGHRFHASVNSRLITIDVFRSPLTTMRALCGDAAVRRTLADAVEACTRTHAHAMGERSECLVNGAVWSLYT